MNYQETVNWLFNQLPMYQTQGASAYKPNLDNTILLANYLNNPEKKLKTIHVAGTNGKGSTSSLLASVLQEAGYKVGLYTSPHLKDYRERIKINGEEITEEFVIDFVSQHKTFFENQQLSFFEMTVGLAFDYFVKENVDIAIIEVGMGGRLDSTNIITPLISVITNIGLDHTQFLGNTLESIAFEKAGIIKPNIHIVIGEYTNETKPVFIKKASETNSEIYFASDLIEEVYPTALLGDYQIQNRKTVQHTLRILQQQNEFTFSEETIKNGFLNVIQNTGLLGRWQQLGDSPKIICDTAHNKHGLSIVLKQIENQEFDQLHIVLGVVNDKDLGEILPLFPKKAKYYFCSPKNLRGLHPEILKEKAIEFGLNGKVYNSVSEAYQEAKETAGANDLIYVGGSTFVVAEIL
ncbi:bifunctional folylpolyglutamate synthase/dihydrofolate synthase [Flavobacterium azooxidireducens]|uniref:Dihydrofolate synthase/folylpolyglutamate synthase n=1 Tax=Flavobacterium azooxidireducens TaxID=1871076 RepID=A0ABY4KAV1_9FLAO|nr:folylpolyglutamate synthase/dihydrofolate synthase family protein [Flavobacterium azooxidireducens]UPQ77869.1 bifunctional folylpolyglutamate synthase/dihydrofolate synthase [Flavobacterium azooxidireducens]